MQNRLAKRTSRKLFIEKTTMTEWHVIGIGKSALLVVNNKGHAGRIPFASKTTDSLYSLQQFGPGDLYEEECGPQHYMLQEQHWYLKITPEVIGPKADIKYKNGKWYINMKCRHCDEDLSVSLKMGIECTADDFTGHQLQCAYCGKRNTVLIK